MASHDEIANKQILAKIERVIEASMIMTPQEKAELHDWERRHIRGDGTVGTSDWPGWANIIKRLSH